MKLTKRLSTKSIVLLAPAALLLGLLFPLPASAMLLLTEDQFDQDNPVISGNNIVWLDWRNGISELWLHDLASGNARGLPLEGAVLNYPEGTPTLWTVSDRMVAWQDLRLGSSAPRVYIHDLPSGPARAAPNPSGVSQSHPVAWGNELAWVEKDVIYYDALADRRVNIPTPNLDFSNHRPSLHNNLLAWYRQAPDGVDSALVVWDSSWGPGRGGEIVWPVEDSSFNLSITPSIWRHPIPSKLAGLAWFERRCDDPDCDPNVGGADEFFRNIYYAEVDLSGSMAKLVGPPQPLAAGPLLDHQWGVRIFGDYVVWNDWGGSRTVAYHLPSRERFVVAGYLGAPPNLALDQGNLVWAAAPTGNADQGEVAVESLTGPRISSSSHPNQLAWYPLPAVVSWSAPLGAAGIQGYSLQLGRSAVPSSSELLDVSCPAGCSAGQLARTFAELGDGVWYFQVRAKLADEFWSPPGSYRLQLDSTSPIVEAGVDQTVPAGGSVRLQGTATDALSGLNAGSEGWSFGDGTTAAGTQVDKTFASVGTYAATFSAKDQAGNPGADSLTVRVVSFIPPGTTGATTTTTTIPPAGAGFQQPAFSAPLGSTTAAAAANAQLQQAASKKPRPLPPFSSVWMYPNPFYPGQDVFFVQDETGKRVSLRTTSFCFTLNMTGHVYVSLFNSKGFLGRMYAKPYFVGNRMFNRYLGPGRYYVGWTGTLNGKLLPPGTYKYVLTASNGSVARTYQGTVTLRRRVAP